MDKKAEPETILLFLFAPDAEINTALSELESCGNYSSLHQIWANDKT